MSLCLYTHIHFICRKFSQRNSFEPRLSAHIKYRFNIKMTFLSDYQLILFTFLMCGYFPATIHSHSGFLIQSTTFYRYSLVVGGLHFVTSFLAFYTRFMSNLSVLIFIGIAANVLISFYMICAYFFISFLFVHKSAEHIRFLNSVVRFDLNIMSKCTIRKYADDRFKQNNLLHLTMKRTLWVVSGTFLFATVHTIVVNLLLRPDQPLADICLEYDLILMKVIMSLTILHMHFCSQLLNDRFQLIQSEFGVVYQQICDENSCRSKLSATCEWLIGRFNELQKSRSTFGKVFSAVLLTTTANDEVQMALCTFMQLKHLSDYGNLRRLSILVLTNLDGFLLPAIRQVMIFGSMNRLAKQVRNLNIYAIVYFVK